MRARERPQRAARCAAVLCALAAAGSALVGAEGSRDPRSILLRAETIDALAAAPLRAGDSVLRSSAGRTEERTYLVHMDDAGDERWRRAVREATGRRLERYIPHNTFLLDLGPEALRRTQALVGTAVVWIGELQPHHKLAAAALQKLDRELDGSARSGAGAAPRTKAAAPPPDAVLVARVRSSSAATLAPHFERGLLRAGFAVSVTAATPQKLHVRRPAADAGGGSAGTGTREEQRPGPQAWAQGVGEWLSQESEVLWVEPKARIKVRNRYAAMTVQGGFPDGQRPCPPCSHLVRQCPSCALAGRTPVWDLGLRGEGEIVGCGDTGIDVDSCFFWDPALASSGRPGPPLAPKIDLAHRKLVSYRAAGGAGTGDASDDVRGHGTHVVGSIVGSVDPSLAPAADVAEHGGMAPAAKVAFFDLERTGGHFDIPDDIEEDYYRWAYEAGARVHSNSWGDDSNDYTVMTADTDKFVFENPDFLVLFAAGNDGDTDPPDHTVGAPATCKNCLSVGASQSDERDALKDGGRIQVVVEAQGGAASVSLSFLAAGASFGPSLDAQTPDSGQAPASGGEITLASYVGEACEPFNTSVAAAFSKGGLICVVTRGTCVFVDKVKHAQEAGAVAVIVTNNVNGDPGTMGGEDEDVNIFAVMISKEDGEAMFNMTRDAPRQALNAELAQASALPSFNQDNLAGFSSLGPTADGRLKPDLVAPGEDIHSAYSDGQPYSYQCEQDSKSEQAALTRMSGTSMATPIVAGAAALARQYFRTGKYHEVAGDGAAWMAQPENGGFGPSAALLRAVLTNGAQDMASFGGRRGSTGPLLKPAPSMEIGYGRLNLAKSLRIPASVAVSPSLIVLDGFAQSAETTTQRAVVGHGAVHRHCFRVAADTSGVAMPLKVTLAWTDPAAEPNSAVALVHNLDLAVYHDGTGKVEYGNHRLRAARLRSRDAGVEEEQELTDAVNPTEQVVIPAADVTAGSVYVVYVMGTKVVTSRHGAGAGDGHAAGRSAEEEATQEYALAITGKNLVALDHQASECLAIACPKDCSGRGQCVQGQCVCEGIFWGVDCAMQKSCPKGPGGQTCSGHGVCDVQLAACECEKGWSGRACEAYSCVSGSIINVSLPVGEHLLVESCSASSAYVSQTACSWQIQPENLQDGDGQSAYLMASIQELEIESIGIGGYIHLYPGCDGSEDCASECEYDALHVVGGMLEAAPDGVSSDGYGQPCHDWAMSQPGYMATYCGSLDYLTDGKPIAIPDMARGQAVSLVFCSDVAVEPGRGFAVSFTAVPCPHNCSGHGGCARHTRAYASDPICQCVPGWAGTFCDQKSTACDPSVPFNGSAFGSGSYVCVTVPGATTPASQADDAVWLSRTEDAQGLLVCAPGYSGPDCTVPHCGGEVNITWTSAEIASHDANHSAQYEDGANCRWLYQVAGAAAGEEVVVNVTLLDLEFQRDLLELTCIRPTDGLLEPTTELVAIFTGNAPCPAWPACMEQGEGSADQPGGGHTCSHGVGDGAASSEKGMCQVQREWRWVAVQVHQSNCPVLSVRFTSDSSKSAAGFTAQMFPTTSELMRPFVEATITFFNHSIADMHNKTRAVLGAVALAAQVPERNVLMTHVVGHMDSRDWRVGSDQAESEADAADKRTGRRPVDSEGRHAHDHVTVTIKVLAHRTDAPEPMAWALYHRLALAEPLTGKYNNTNSTRRPHRSLPRSSTAEYAYSAYGDSGEAPTRGGSDEAPLWGRRSAVDDTLWVWGLDGQWAASGVWKDSEGEGTAIIEVCPLGCVGVVCALALRRLSPVHSHTLVR